ncbi:hypothetical protein O181_075731 [Austropuccinia psidii MF-1]|uniref:DUF659 domain-containing protein n=1 Tax=Austropuccinia psidii MF-1 TaxID=1389203 RepID=A0A9Q3FF27_9BASI|nr:hypothetical protein [Austropuccinia psidii MF-1]
MMATTTSDSEDVSLAALIISNIPFRFLYNKYFQEYQCALVQSPYKLPTRDSISKNVLPLLHAKHEEMILQQACKSKGMTLSIDGWTEISGYSLYALLLLQGQYVKQFINILDLKLKWHTSENIYEAVKKCMQRKQISFQNICAIVTDSPSVMIKFQTLLTRDHPHIMRVHCILHAFNLIAKDFMNHPIMASIIKGNKMLVNYFTSSLFWSEYLSQWADKNKIRHGLSTLCESQWYSLAKVCLSIQSHEEGFKKCLILFQNPSSDTPTTFSAIISIIESAITSHQMMCLFPFSSPLLTALLD